MEKMERMAGMAPYAGGGSAVYFGLTLNEIGVVVGIVVGVLGLMLNAYFKMQHLRIARQVADTRPDCMVCPDRKEAEL